MHYGAKSFSKDGKDTIKIIDPAVKVTLGQRTALSATDAKQLALLYKCPTGMLPGGGGLSALAYGEVSLILFGQTSLEFLTFLGCTSL